MSEHNSWQAALSAGHADLRQAKWDAARTHFEASLRAHETPAAHDGLGLALWWLNDVPAAHRHRIAAYSGYRQVGELRRAALLAAWLAREQLFLDGNSAAMHGWFARAERLQVDIGACAESAWCTIYKSSVLDPPDRLAQRAHEVAYAARAFGDPSLEAFALAFGGLAHVARGQVADGMAMLDEAMTMATSGEVHDHNTASEVFCVLLSACETAGDLVRSEQWCRVAMQYAERYGAPFLSAYCLTTYGSLLTALGRWHAAEQALTRAIQAFDAGHRGLRVHALFKLAELRINQGKLGEAAALLAGYEDQPAALLPLARLHLAQGDHALAEAVVAQALLAADAETTLYQIPLLLLSVNVALERGNVAATSASVARLDQLGAHTTSPFLLAQTAMVRGRVALHSDRTEASKQFARAIQLLTQYEQSLLAGQARLGMAYATQQNDPPGAIAWARAALATFQRIGASGHAAEAAALLRALGVATPGGGQAAGELTGREGEVLTLVAEGLTNSEIAQRLYLSPKTVEHHVSRILAKLGLRNRAEAAAWALAEGIAALPRSDRRAE